MMMLIRVLLSHRSACKDKLNLVCNLCTVYRFAQHLSPASGLAFKMRASNNVYRLRKFYMLEQVMPVYNVVKSPH